MTESSKHIQDPVRLSESMLWELQRNYFDTMGIDAWENDIPFYITNNAFIGHQYAYLVYQYMLDWQNLHGANQTIDVLELGCGVGRFCFYFIRALKSLLKEKPLNVNFRYILTDVTEKNVKFCEDNLCFEEFINEGILDFAVFDAELDESIHLRHLDKPYTSINDGPLVVIANYIFDCLKHDSLQIKESKYYDILHGINSRFSGFDTKAVKYINELKFPTEDVEITLENYYEETKIVDILKNYLEQCGDDECFINVPTACFAFMRNIKKLTNNRFLLLLGDKGVTTFQHQLQLPSRYRMTYEGCMTMLTNFYIIGDYARALGGDCLVSQKSRAFQVCLYTGGSKVSDLPNLELAYKQFTDVLGPQEYATLYDQTVQNAYRFTGVAISAFLKFSRWDPDAYAIVHDRLVEVYPVMLVHEKIEIKEDLRRVEENVYRLALGYDVNNLLGLFYLSQEQEDRALDLYHRAIETYGDHPSPNINAGLIYEKRKEKEKAIKHFKVACEKEPNNKFARYKLDLLLGRKYPIIFRPILRMFAVTGLLAGLVYLAFMR